MEHQFKFGDVAQHKETGEIFVISDFGEDEGFLAAMSKETAIVWDVKAEELELIPHPDTARLNWLEKQMLEDSQETIVCDGYNGFCTIGNFREHRPTIFENIRDAIDHEMKKQGQNP